MDKNQVLKIFAENLRTLLNEKNISNQELARRSQCSSGTISKILNGQMSVSIPLAITLAESLGVNANELISGLSSNQNRKTSPAKQKSLGLSIGILSINNKRLAYIKDNTGNIVGYSSLEGGLDLVETTGALMNLIYESILKALNKTELDSALLKNSNLNLVTQSYEFEETRSKFHLFAKKTFNDVLLLPDWQITHMVDFDNSEGICLVVDKGVSLSYKENGLLKKLGGWKFPVYDLGGENWLGVETIRHTIDAVEGYVPMSNLAKNVMAKFNGKIEKITETCFKGNKDADIYCLFSEPLIKAYFLDEKIAKAIIENGFHAIFKMIKRVDDILGKQVDIAIYGSLADIYKKFLPKDRIVEVSTDDKKAKALATVTKAELKSHGILQNE